MMANAGVGVVGPGIYPSGGGGGCARVRRSSLAFQGRKRSSAGPVRACRRDGRIRRGVRKLPAGHVRLIGVVVAREDMVVGRGPAERDGCAGGGCLDIVGDRAKGGGGAAQEGLPPGLGR